MALGSQRAPCPAQGGDSRAADPVGRQHERNLGTQATYLAVIVKIVGQLELGALGKMLLRH